VNLVTLLEEIQSRVDYAGIAQCKDLQPDGSQPEVQFSIHDEVTGNLAPGRIVTCAEKYFNAYRMPLPCKIFCSVKQKGGFTTIVSQIIYVKNADEAEYGSTPIINYDPATDTTVIPKTDKWFGKMQQMVDAGLITSWAFKNVEQTNLGSDVIGNVKLINRGTPINLDGTPAESGDGFISLWEDKDGNIIQIFRD
jgi:hypothetical protein